MNWLDAGELAQLRIDILDTLPDTCDIMSVSRVPDGHGGFSETWTTASTVACRMDHKTGAEVLAGGAVQTYQGNMLTLPYNATITTAYRVSYGGGLYNVISVSEGSSVAVKRVVVEYFGIAAVTFIGLDFSIATNSQYVALI